MNHIKLRYKTVFALLMGGWISFPEAHAATLRNWDLRRESPKTLRIFSEFTFAGTTANYDGAAKSAAVPGLKSYQKQILDLHLTYGLSERWSLYGRISGTRVEFETVAPATPLQGSGTGFSDHAAGLNYRLLRDKNLSIDLQAQVEFPGYTVAKLRQNTPSSPLPGDGTIDTTIGGFIVAPLSEKRDSRLFVVTGAGYMSRTRGFSPAIPYVLTLTKLPLQSGFFWRLGFFGFRSFRADAGKITQLDPAYTPRDAGGSLTVNALNSSYVNARIYVGYQFSPTFLVLGGFSKHLMGQSTANLTTIHAGLQIRLQGQQTPTKLPDLKKVLQAEAEIEYDFEVAIKQSNPNLQLVKIEAGEDQGIELKQKFDLFAPGDAEDSWVKVGRAFVGRISKKEAILKVMRLDQEVWIKDGSIAKRVVEYKRSDTPVDEGKTDAPATPAVGETNDPTEPQQ